MTPHIRVTLVIGGGTLLEALRNRVLLVSLAFAVILVGLSVSAAAVSYAEQARLIVDIGLAAASGLGGVVALALAITSFASELRQRTAYPVLVRPVTRGAFVLGKFVGLWAAMSAVVALMLIATAGVVILFGASLPAAFWGALYLTALEMGILIALAILFSCFTVPALAATYAGAVTLAGHLSEDLLALAQRMQEKGSPLLGQCIELAYYLLPNLQKLSLRTEAANYLPVPAGVVGYGTLYALGYISALLLLAMFIFGRRQAV